MENDMVPFAGVTEKLSLMGLKAPPPLPEALKDVRNPGTPSPNVRAWVANEDLGSTLDPRLCAVAAWS